MPNKVTIWLSDEDFKLLQAQSDKKGIKAYQLAQVWVAKKLGVFPDDTSLADFLVDYEIETRSEAEKKYGVNSTRKRVQDIVGVSSRAMSTTEILDALGWAQSHGLAGDLRDWPEFIEVPQPTNAPRRRGRQPKYWTLAEVPAEAEKPNREPELGEEPKPKKRTSDKVAGRKKKGKKKHG